MAQERLAKIVCTIGPASLAEGIIEQMARAGMAFDQLDAQLFQRRSNFAIMLRRP